jgi:FemAB-related protein (PEP-CTERM system-associated)
MLTRRHIAAFAAAPPLDGAIAVSAATASDEWDAYVRRQPHATGYHGWAWKQVFERAFGHRTDYLAARRGSAIVGVLPLVQLESRLFGRFMVSLPFVNYGGVVADDDAAGAALVSHAAMLAAERGLAHVELRHVARQFPALPAKQHKVTMLLDLERDTDALWTRLDRRIRNHVRKAEKAGVQVTAGGGALLDEFYGVFATNMRDLGTPVYGRGLFQEVVAALGDRATVFVARVDGRTAAAGITLHQGDTVEVPWSSSLREYRATSANTLLYWRMIAAAAAHARRFDFGRSSPGDGPFQFKQQWGARPTPLFWEYVLAEGAPLPDLRPANPKFRLAVRVWQQLPVAVATAIGPRIVRYIP